MVPTRKRARSQVPNAVSNDDVEKDMEETLPRRKVKTIADGTLLSSSGKNPIPCSTMKKLHPYGRFIVFCGTFTTQTRNQLEAQATKLGYVVSAHVSCNTNVFVYGENVGKIKRRDAEKMGAKVLSEAEWKGLLQNDGVEAGKEQDKKQVEDMMKTGPQAHVVVITGHWTEQDQRAVVVKEETVDDVKEEDVVIKEERKEFKKPITTRTRGSVVAKEAEDDENEQKERRTSSSSAKPAKSTGGNGAVVVFTGKLTKHTRSAAWAIAKKHGYVVGLSITKATNVLVCGERVGATKTLAAEKFGVEMISEAEWEETLAGGGRWDGDYDEDDEEEDEDEVESRNHRVTVKAEAFEN